jgi:hypothetical protein
LVLASPLSLSLFLHSSLCLTWHDADSLARVPLQKKVSPGIGDFADRYFCTED